MEKKKKVGLGIFAVVRHWANENWILLVRDTYREKKWGLPGGGLEVGELVPDGLIREIREETGYQNVEIKENVGVFSSKFGNVPVLLFDCRLLDEERKDFDAEEILACNFFELGFGLCRRNDVYLAQKHLINYALWPKSGRPYYGWLS